MSEKGKHEKGLNYIVEKITSVIITSEQSSVREEEARLKIRIHCCIHRICIGILAPDTEPWIPKKPLLNNEICNNSVHKECLTTTHFADCGGHCIITLIWIQMTNSLPFINFKLPSTFHHSRKLSCLISSMCFIFTKMASEGINLIAHSKINNFFRTTLFSFVRHSG